MAQPIPIFRGTPEHGKIRWQGDDGRRWAMALGMLEGKESEFTARAKRRKRSLSQNSWFHGCIVPMVAEALKELGHENIDAKEILKYRFLKVGEGDLAYVRHTSELSTKEMAEFTDQCIRWAAEFLHIFIPDPGQVDY